jgi:hypothetical protein
LGRLGDHILQVVFVGALVLVVLTFYFSRIASLQANDQINNGQNIPYSDLVTVYQYEQEEKNILTQIKILKADYASAINLYQTERLKVETSLELSELEKREKLQVLENKYSKQYFSRKLDLLDESQSKLALMREAKCAKFCLYLDLPVGL